MWLLKIAGGFVAGGLAGAVCGFAANTALFHVILLTPQIDGRVIAIVAIILVPIGALVGAVIGVALVADWTKQK